MERKNNFFCSFITLRCNIVQYSYYSIWNIYKSSDLNFLILIKGTLMQIWKSPYMFKFT